jgi:plastocyanin
LTSLLLAACGQQTPAPAATAPGGDGGQAAPTTGAAGGYPAGMATPVESLPLPAYPGDGSTGGGQPETVVIVYEGETITPAEVTVKAGTLVQFQSRGAHQPYNDTAPNVFEGPQLADGESWATVFSEAGTFTILCRLHPAMRGTITVEP